MSALPMTLEASRATVPWLAIAGACALAAVVLAGLGLGAVHVPPPEVLAALLSAAGLPAPSSVDPLHASIVVQLRLPRVLLGLGVGASLGLSGALVQGWFRNPLAEPGLLGVSGGAALAAATTIVFAGGVLGGAAVPLAAFAGGLAAVALVHRLGTLGGRADVTTLLLAGLALTAVAGAGTGLLVTVADDDQLRDITFWTLGSVGGATWSGVRWVLPALAVGVVASLRLARPLDALLLGEATASHLGVDVTTTQRAVALAVAWLVGLSVAATGLIGFLGLVAPHMVRLITGPRHRALLPGSALLGAILLAASDLAARIVVAPVELPVGVLTTLLGGPLFLFLLLRTRGGLR